MTRLNNAISPGDAHAIDVRYHKVCWTRHVFHVLRDDACNQVKSPQIPLPMQMSCLIELINLVDVHTQSKAYLPMDVIETTYISMLGGKDEAQKHIPTLTRQWLKDKILPELPTVKSTRQKDRRKPSLLYCPEACEEDMVCTSLMQNSTNEIEKTKMIYKTAKMVCESISKSAEEEENNAMIVSSTRDDIPTELYSLIRWILVGSEEELQTEVKNRTVDRSALTICQNIMYAFKTRRQVQHKHKRPSDAFRIPRSRENPQVLGLALTIHHDTRNKTLMNLLHAQNYCISYSRTLLLETAIANAVVENTKKFGGLYVPPFLKKGTFVFFAIDNTDLAEDTVDGKGTTHGTITAVYQKASASGEHLAPSLEIHEAKNLSVLPYHVPIKPCGKPKPGPYKRDHEFEVNSGGVAESYQLNTLGWMIASALSSRSAESELQVHIPDWAGYKSLVSPGQSVSQVGALPLLPEVAREWPTIMTVMLQASHLKTLVVGQDHPAVITFDMALYEKAVQLLDARPNLKDEIVLRLGELHTVMASLRALGTSIENSGIDDAWIEADVYGSSTVRQILKCSHYKRALSTHIYTYMALYELVLEQFFTEMPHLMEDCLSSTKEIQEACINMASGGSDGPQCIRIANTNLLEVLKKEEVIQQLKTWEEQKSSNAMFKSLMNYLHRVETILFFVEASRNADITLHLEAGEALSKLFFAFDRIKYKRLWPRYIADMHELKTKHPATWKELEDGNLSVTKSEISFISLGSDHACEHLNRMMKVHTGLVGISNNSNARQHFFLASPEISRLSTEFKGQFGLQVNKPEGHHDVQLSTIRQERQAVDKIKAAILSHGNPFAAEGTSYIISSQMHMYHKNMFHRS